MKNVTILLLMLSTFIAGAQNLLIKSVHIAKDYGAYSNNLYDFSIVELEVLVADMPLTTLETYSIRVKRTGTHSSSPLRTISLDIAAGGDLEAQNVTGYPNNTLTRAYVDADLEVGASLYFIEMTKNNSGIVTQLTDNSNDFYGVFKQYMGFTQNDMINAKYFTSKSKNKTLLFYDNLLVAGALFEIQDSNNSATDKWKYTGSGLVNNSRLVRNVNSPSSAVIPTDWDYTNFEPTASVNKDYNHFENQAIQNPIATGATLTFKSNFQKEVKIYDFSGVMKVQTIVGSSFVIPDNLSSGVYILRVNSEKGVSVHKLIVK